MDSFSVMSKRLFKRAICALAVDFEFAKWNDDDETHMHHPEHAVSHDLSPSGIGLEPGIEISGSYQRKLEEGTMKLRLGIHLDDGHGPVRTFARLVWIKHDERFGFSFIDISTQNFKRLQEYVDARFEQSQ